MPEPVKPTPTAPSTLAVGDIYYILFRNKWLILILSFLGLLASGVVYLLTPAVYQSEARLLVRSVPDVSVLDNLSQGERVMVPNRNMENVINSEIEVLSSPDLAERVLNEMGTEQFLVEPSNIVHRAKLANKIMAAIRIEASKNSNVIRVSFGGRTPQVSQEFLRRLTESYLQKHADIHRSIGAYEFLSQQTDQLRSRLVETDENLRKLKTTEGIVSIEDAKTAVSRRMSELANGLDDMEIALPAARARVEVLRSVLATSSVNRAVGSTAEQAAAALQDANQFMEYRAHLLSLQKKESDMLLAYTTNSIPLQTLREQIAKIQALLTNENFSNAVAGTVTSDLATIQALVEEQANVAALQARIGAQKEVLQREVEKARKVAEAEPRILQLERSKTLQEANYNYFCRNLEQARVDEALNAGRLTNVNIVQAATLPTRKSWKKLPKKMGLALIAGIALGLGLAMLREFVLDNTIQKAAELPVIFRSPLVMTLPKLKCTPQCLRKGDGQAATQKLSHASLQARNSGDLDAWDEIMELCDSLRMQLLSNIGADQTTKPYLLGITSCASGSGVSTLANGLAQALAREVDGNVVLLDASMDTGKTVCYEVNADGGLVANTPVTQITPAVPQHGNSISTGSAGTKPSGSSRTQELAGMLQGMRAGTARFVIVDLPPVMETGLTLRVVRLLDGVLVVIPSEKITRSVAEHVRRWLAQSNAKIVGCVLNMRRKYVPAWLCQRL